MPACPFCAIVTGAAPATIVREWDDAMAIVPLSPVVQGHALVIPRCHVRDATEDPAVTGATMARAAELAEAPCNIITSAGSAATQTMLHLHVHVVPRREGDRLALPWSRPFPDVVVWTVPGTGELVNIDPRDVEIGYFTTRR